jgi:deoxyribose-phosphate aldolase
LPFASERHQARIVGIKEGTAALLLKVEPLELEQLLDSIAAELLAAKGRLCASLVNPPAVNLPAPAGTSVASADSDSEPTVDSGIAALIDHTILRPDASAEDVRKVCAEALQYGFASVCVNPARVALVASELRGSTVKTCSVAGFPLGATSTAAKMCEAELAIRAGAQEVDMVINVGALKDRDYQTVMSDIQDVAQVCHAGKALLKVIIEACLLEDSEKAIACVIAKLAGADFVKTSTGFSKSGATAADVALMRRVVGPELGVKAAGGIRTLEDLLAMVEAGASRVGASASVKIVEASTRRVA